MAEIAVIVIGIAIALTGEQIVERIHEHQMAAEARDQIRSEVATDLAVLGNRIKVEPCLDRRFAEIRQMLANGGTAAYVAPSLIGRPDEWDNQNGRWQAAAQSGRVALLSSGEQLGFSFIYGQLAQIRAGPETPMSASSIRTFTAPRKGVAHPSSTLIDAARPALRQAMADDEAIRVRIAESTKARRGMGIAPVRSPVESTFNSVCLPTTTPAEEGYKKRADAIRDTDFTAGRR